MLLRFFITSPLRWLDAFLSSVTSPFANAPDIRRYATNGYYLLGVTLVVATLLVWFVLSGPLGQLSVRLRGDLGFLLEPLGLGGLPAVFVLLAPLTLAYILGYLIRPVRFYVGEKFADTFFGLFGILLEAGDWCVENRWATFFIVVLLGMVIAWSAFYLFEQARRGAEPVMVPARVASSSQ